MIHSKGFFKHSDAWYLLPCPKLILERLGGKNNREYVLTIEITFWHWTTYLTIKIKKTWKH
jgi:hypothetical protein